jgi:hypothetical protein
METFTKETLKMETDKERAPILGLITVTTKDNGLATK